MEAIGDIFISPIVCVYIYIYIYTHTEKEIYYEKLTHEYEGWQILWSASETEEQENGWLNSVWCKSNLKVDELRC